MIYGATEDNRLALPGRDRTVTAVCHGASLVTCICVPACWDVHCGLRMAMVRSSCHAPSRRSVSRCLPSTVKPHLV